MGSIPEKQCTKCKEIFPLTHEYFAYNRSTKLGFQCWCKTCQRDQKRIKDEQAKVERGWRKEVLPEGLRRCGTCKEIKPATREYFTVNPNGKCGLQSFCKVCGAIQQKQYRLDNPERVRAADRKRNLNPYRREQQKTRQKAYYYRDPLRHEKTRIKNQIRRARLVNADGYHTKEDVQKQYKAQKGKCWWCGKQLNGVFDADHLIPISRGGTNWANNIVCTCQFCNSSKNDRMPWEWAGKLL